MQLNSRSMNTLSSPELGKKTLLFNNINITEFLATRKKVQLKKIRKDRKLLSKLSEFNILVELFNELNTDSQ